jgi:acyl-CoA dehydrogenase
MLNFTLTPENIEWKNYVRDFVREHVMNRTDLDEHGHFPWDLYQKAFDAGIITSMIPSEYGGGGKSFVDSVLAAEEAAYGDLGFTTSTFLMRLSLAPLLLFGTEEQKQKWITPITKELKFASFGFTEPLGSTNLGSRPATTVAKKVEGGYIINGVKDTISNGSVASVYTIFARIEGEEHTALSCFVIGRESEGVSVGEPYKKMGQRCADTAMVFFKDVFVPQEDMLGRPGQGSQIALKSLRQSRVGVGAMAVGVCSRARDLARTQLHERKTGEGKPLIYENGIKFRLAEMDAKIEMLHSFVLRATWEIESGGAKATKLSSSVKLLGGRLANEICHEALDLHGGRGYLEEYKIEKLVRDARVLSIFEGTEAVQQLIISETVIRPSSGGVL